MSLLNDPGGSTNFPHWKPFQNLFRNGRKRFRDEEEAEDLEMTKMNIRRHLKEVSTGFWSIVRSVCLVNVIELTIQIFELEKEVIRFFSCILLQLFVKA